MAIIRKKLTPEDMLPKTARINPTTGEYETSPNGGIDWNPDPESDPRHNDAYRLPPTDAPDPKCDGAARIVAAFQDEDQAMQSCMFTVIDKLRKRGGS